MLSILGYICAIILFLIFIFVAYKLDKKEEEVRNQTEAESLAKLEALKLSGTGDTMTKKFELENGFVVIEVIHQGTSNFLLELLDSNENPLELVVNHYGNYKGKKIYNISSGGYLYNVTSDGSWTIQMSQEIPRNVITNGISNGIGDSVVFMELEKGVQTFSFSHDGKSNFIVILNGSGLLVNEIGNYSGTRVKNIDETAIYFFDITADGNWTMEIL